VAYVVKRYPRYSETFIVNELLAHEAAGLDLEIFSVRPPIDAHFQDVISRVRAPVTYVPSDSAKAATLWHVIQQTAQILPGLWPKLAYAAGEDALDLLQGLWLAGEVRRREITHLHAHFGNVAASVARLAAYFAGIPYTLTAHAKDIFHQDVVSDALSCKLRDAAAVVTVSDFNEHYLHEHYGDAAARVTRIYNGLDLERFRFEAPHSRPRIILSVGRLVEKKGFDVLIDACKLLKNEGVVFTCQIIGSGPDEAALQAQIARLNVQDVVALSGPRPQREVIAAVQGAAVFAAPCVVGSDNNMDGLPTVLLEAMALGTPCVSTPVTGIPEAIFDGETGLLVPQRDPCALAVALRRLLDDAALRVQLATAARQRIETEFNVVQSTARLRDLFAAAQQRVAACV